MASGEEQPPLRIPLTIGPEQRQLTNNVDAKIVNGYLEKDLEGGVKVNKRPSLNGSAGAATGVGRGVFRWNTNIYQVIGGFLWKDTNLLGAVQNSGAYWFEITKGTPSYLYLSNGSFGYTVTSTGTFAQITDINYPPSTVPGSAYLDGTVYVFDLLARIWGTAGLNNPTTWSATNVIVAQVEPDPGVALAKQNIYVIALKAWSTEVFYDAGNATGSPLLPVLNAKQSYGCVDGLTVQSVDDKLFWVSANRTGGLRVVKMEKLICTVISTFPVDRWLEANIAATSVRSYAVRLNGHSFYFIQPFSSFAGALIAPLTTLAYDIENDNWYFWEQSPGVGLPINSAAGSEGQLSNAITLQEFSTAALVGFEEANYQGDATISPFTKAPIACEVITPLFDGGVKNEKVMTRLKIVADSLGAGMLWVRYTDDDYKTWSNWIQVPLQDEFPQISELGTFRRRAFHLRHASPTPLRISALEPELLLCPF